MYPTLFIGVLVVGAAVGYAWRPERQRLKLVVWMQVLTMLVGTFGFVSGMIKSAMSAGQTPAPVETLIQGFGEALHNVALGLGFVVLAGIAGAIGLARGKRGAGKDGALVDPFA
ncbi:MAG TPA: hypothetical protein VNO30_35110 [Kofleriaceae bacterium]|nr:hypothetical protein [Kofleriaceae bacterium]